MVLDGKTNFFPRKKMVLGRKNQLFPRKNMVLEKPKKPKKPCFGETMIVFFCFP